MQARTQEEELIGKLIEESRRLVSEGSGSAALETLIKAIIANTGEQSVMRILDAANERAKLEKQKEIRQMMRKCCEDLVQADSLLAEVGDENLLVEAFQDGSSVICQRCNGLVAVDRADAHSKFWCPALEGNEEDGDVLDC